MLKDISWNKIYLGLIGIIIFLIPSNLFLKLFTTTAYVNGLLVDYLIPKIYLSDIFIMVLLILWSIEVIKKKKIKNKLKFSLPMILALAVISRQFFAPYPRAAFWYLLKLSEILCLGKFLSTHPKLLRQPLILYTTLTTLIFQSSLAFYQFFTQRSLLGYLFFGELDLSHSIGLAKDTFWQTGRVLPYATTAHPNILGGVLAILSLFVFHKLLSTKKIWLKIAIIGSLLLSMLTLSLTQSISAGLCFIIGGLAVLVMTNKKYLLKNNKFKQAIPIFITALIVATPVIIQLLSSQYPHSDSLRRRAYLQTAANKMWTKHPLLGVGLDQFTARVEEFSLTQEIVRFVQPVHHLGLLWLAETGLLGVLLLVIMAQKIDWPRFIKPTLILLPLVVLDHYLLTQQSGLLLAVFALNWFL